MKKIGTYIIITCTGLFFLVACDKSELPEPFSGDPVFYFDGQVDGNAVNIKAGLNDYYMYTSSSTDLQGVHSFIGNLSKTGCINCPGALKIEFRDYRNSLITPTDIDTSLAPGNFNLATPGGNTVSYSVNFSQNSLGGTVVSYDWDFGDGTNSTVPNPVHVYTAPGNYLVCLSVQFSSGCSRSICNNIMVGFATQTCEAAFNVSTPSGNTFNFLGTSTGSGPLDYAWAFGDGNISALPNPSHTYSVPGTFTVSLQITDATGCVSMKNQNIRTQSSTDCIVIYQFNTTPVVNSANLGNVIVEWADASGNVFTSKNNAQPAESTFEILSLEQYKDNENGRHVKKLQVRFDCSLYNGATSINILTDESVIGVAYP